MLGADQNDRRVCERDDGRLQKLKKYPIVAELRAQHSTMSRKIWLSMHPRNFGCLVDVNKYTLLYVYLILQVLEINRDKSLGNASFENVLFKESFVDLNQQYTCKWAYN